jgi:hypothetical protein
MPYSAMSTTVSLRIATLRSNSLDQSDPAFPSFQVPSPGHFCLSLLALALPSPFFSLARPNPPEYGLTHFPRIHSSVLARLYQERFILSQPQIWWDMYHDRSTFSHVEWSREDVDEYRGGLETKEGVHAVSPYQVS